MQTCQPDKINLLDRRHKFAIFSILLLEFTKSVTKRWHMKANTCLNEVYCTCAR